LVTYQNLLSPSITIYYLPNTYRTPTEMGVERWMKDEEWWGTWLWTLDRSSLFNILSVFHRSCSRSNERNVMAVWMRNAGLALHGGNMHPGARYGISRAWLVALVATGAMLHPACAGTLVLPRDAARSIDLSAFNGNTYLQAALHPGDGINAKTAVDDGTAVTIANTTAMLAAFATFDANTANHLYSHFNNGQADFVSDAGHIAGQSLNPQQIESALTPFLTNVRGQLRGAKASASNLILLTSGSGTVVQLTPNDYFYNVAYQSPVTSSGRSYGVTATRKLLDATDNYYLTELDNFLISSSEQQISDFYKALFKLLTACDASGLSGLTPSGQSVLTDLMAVYTAELMRHNMVNMDVNTDTWDTDIAEVTLVSAYIAISGRVMVGGKLVSGDPTAYAQGHSIGTYKADFMKLGKLITSYENASNHHHAMVKAVKDATPVTTQPIKSALKGDVFRQALVFLDLPQFESQAQANAAAIITAMAQLLTQIRADQSQITAYVLAHQ